MYNFHKVKMTESSTIYHVKYIKFKHYNEKMLFSPFIPHKRL